MLDRIRRDHNGSTWPAEDGSPPPRLNTDGGIAGYATKLSEISLAVASLDDPEPTGMWKRQSKYTGPKAAQLKTLGFASSSVYFAAGNWQTQLHLL